MRSHIEDYGMVRKHSKTSLFELACYRVCIVGYLETSWSEYCGGMTIEHGSDPLFHTSTLLTGRLIDQSALIGVLNALHDIGCPILSVEYLEAG
jgi:hypothetical protein